MTYFTDYPTEPIGGSNPYYRCAFCKVSVPQINGTLEQHCNYCEYRIFKTSFPDTAFNDFNRDSITFHGKILTSKDKHWCNDWDGLPIDDTCEEYKYCTCKE